MPDEMRTLLLMRHAEAAAGLLGTDHDRELTARGHAEAKRAGEHLAGVGRIDHVLVSSARRTQQTFTGVVAGGAQVRRHELRDDIYEASIGAILEAVQTVPDDVRTLLVIGHSPGIPGLATTLANDPSAPYPSVRMPKGFAPATIVRLGVDRPWLDLGPGQADLVEVVEPER